MNENPAEEKRTTFSISLLICGKCRMKRMIGFLLLLALLPLALSSAKITGPNWPSFRGPSASGVADGQDLPAAWDLTIGKNLKWKTPIPGLAHSSPILWGNRIFVTTAVSSLPDATFKPGLYGEGTASEDRSSQQWKIYALNKDTGKIEWERIAFEGTPREKRHIKNTYASSTPVTDGRILVAFFGSQGLYAFDMNGKKLWNKDLGVLYTGAYDAPEYEWGNASSPVIYRELVIVQCDTSKGSFLTGIDLKSGKTVWKTDRDELPSWSTPTIYPGKNRTVLVTNSPNFIRGYDPDTGKELWRLGGSSKITAPTPVFSEDLIVVASGRRPEAPIFVIRGAASGDITLPTGSTTSQFIAWSRQQRGSYMPTPLIYQGFLYVSQNQGILDCYNLLTGQEIYRERLPHKGSGFSASPVASDGKIFLSSEDGDVFVVKAGSSFSILATNPLGEPLMATPAISGGRLYIRAQHFLCAIGQ
jgi:outer membrane protein assembly factor BamB